MKNIQIVSFISQTDCREEVFVVESDYNYYYNYCWKYFLSYFASSCVCMSAHRNRILCLNILFFCIQIEYKFFIGSVKLSENQIYCNDKDWFSINNDSRITK